MRSELTEEKILSSDIINEKNLKISRLNPEEITDELLEQIKTLHTTEWAKNGLCQKPESEARRVENFDLSETFFVMKGNKLLAMINTLPRTEESFAELCKTYPNYNAVVEQSMADAKNNIEKENPKYRFCFSITAARAENGKGYKVETAEGKKTMADYLLSNLPKDKERIVAYSRFGNVPEGLNTKDDETMLEFYRQNIHNSYGGSEKVGRDDRKKASLALGATWMHTKVGGALEVAILLDSRPNDKSGGKANVLCAYPKDEKEKELFESIRQKRMTGKFSYELDKNGNIIFTDIDI